MLCYHDACLTSQCSRLSGSSSVLCHQASLPCDGHWLCYGKKDTCRRRKARYCGTASLDPLFPSRTPRPVVTSHHCVESCGLRSPFRTSPTASILPSKGFWPPAPCPCLIW